MYNFFPENVSVITVVVLTDNGGSAKPHHKFRLAKSRYDIAKRFALDRAGQPVIGPRTYRELTKKELAAANLVGAEYVATLVPIGNTGV